MSDNFQFLKKVNANLYNIITEAEKLYRDEYFEQCMTQTRRFGEQVCREILSQNKQTLGSFDEMITVLKDNANGNIQEKEFINDLYFLKRNGNISVHSSKVKRDGMTALECLKRAFEIAINYSVYSQGASNNILKLNYDVELLITGKKNNKSLKEKYEEEKFRQSKVVENITSGNMKNKTQKEIKKFDETKIKISFFGKFIFVLITISILIIIVLQIMIKIK